MGNTVNASWWVPGPEANRMFVSCVLPLAWLALMAEFVVGLSDNYREV